tara:strand:+ start:375 stop:593 length:219 start_codon:yes stop_codon:yes gene_type:complete
MDLAETAQKTSLLTKKGYFERFFEIQSNLYSGMAAFEMLEREVYKVYGVNKYSSYYSFKTMKSRYLRSLQKK